MAVLTGILIQRMMERARLSSQHRGSNDNKNNLGAEQRTLLINFVIFEVSYLCRAAFDISLTKILDKIDDNEGSGTFYASMAAFFVFDGIPYIILLLFHRKNF